MLTEHQKAVLELIRQSSFNNFDGVQVATDLEKNSESWIHVKPCNQPLDSIIITPRHGCEWEVMKMVETWKADESYPVQTEFGEAIKLWWD